MVEDTSAAIRLLLLGDVGRSTGYHVGDDAMLAGLLYAAAEQGVRVAGTVLAAEPHTAERRFGLPAVPSFGFADHGDAHERRRRLAAITDNPGEQAAAQLAAIQGVDALLVTGGGNLGQSWPALVYERVAAARLAQRCGVPVLLSGQSLGPSFGAELRPLVRELLTGARLVGVRERFAYWLARQLGVADDRLWLATDDAAGLPAQPPPAAAQLTGQDFIAVTVNDLGAELDALASQLSALAQRTGARLVFVPHLGDLAGAPTEDVAVAHRLADATGGMVVELPTPTEAVWYARHAATVLSSRYHPIVFATANGVPALFLHQDGYTAMKGLGGLQLAGLDGWGLSVAAAAGGALLPAGLELWQRREEIQRHLAGLVLGGDLSVLVRHLPELIAGCAGRLPDRTTTPPVDGPRPAGDWAENRQSLTVGDLLELELAGTAGALDAVRRRAGLAEAYAAGLLQRAERAEQYAASLEGRAATAEEYARSVELRAQRAEQYAASLREMLDGPAGDRGRP